MTSPTSKAHTPPAGQSSQREMGRFVVYSPLGSEILAEFRYTDSFSEAEARQKARAARAEWKAHRERVGIRQVRS